MGALKHGNKRTLLGDLWASEKILASSANDPALILAAVAARSATPPQLRYSALTGFFLGGPTDWSPGQAFGKRLLMEFSR